MANPFGIMLDEASLRWAAAEGVPEAAIAAIHLLHAERSVDDVVVQLTTTELEQVINIAGRSPQVYPPGVYAALKGKRDLGSLPPQAERPSKKQAGPLQNAAAPPQNAADRETGMRDLTSPLPQADSPPFKVVLKKEPKRRPEG